MHRPPPAITRSIVVTPLVLRSLIGSLAALMLCVAASLSGLIQQNRGFLIDFEDFYVVGRMALRGEIADAYRITALLDAQFQFAGVRDFMPWTYPPPFDLVVTALACLPVGVAYLVFTGGTLTAFLLVLRAIAGPGFPVVVLAVYPALLMTIRCGQNGCLTATLIGLACLALRSGRAIAGVPLGLMVIKPHLVVGFAVHALLTRGWRCIALAIGTAGAAVAVATWAFGLAVWPAFFAATGEARLFLAEGEFPLFRMISIYAPLRGMLVPAPIAAVVQGLVAVAALGLVVIAVRRSFPTTRVLGVTVLASLLVSPYAYDYDLPIYAIGLAFLLPDVLRLGQPIEQVALIGLSIAAGAVGWQKSTLLQDLGATLLSGAVDTTLPVKPASVAGLLMPAIIALIWHVLQRDRAPVGAAKEAAIAMTPSRSRQTIGNPSQEAVL